MIDHALRVVHERRVPLAGTACGPTGGRSCPPILVAMQRYGLIVADNGSDWYVQGVRDADRTNRLLDRLKRVPARAFVAVDARACRVPADSAAFAYGPGCPAPS